MYEKLKKYMLNFDISELKAFLGNQLTELLVEWLPENQPLYTEENLVNMILSIYGCKVLENSNFRERLLRAMEISTLESFKKYMPAMKDKGLKELAYEVSRIPWTESEINKHLLSILEIPTSIFYKEQESVFSVETINAYDKFFELLDYQFLIRQKIITYMDSDNELVKMVVRMPTGTGKTKTAMHTIIHQYVFKYKKRGLVIWLAHTKELLEQALKTFCNVWRHIGDGEISVYKMWDRYNTSLEQLEDGFLFCGIQKFMSIHKSNQELFDKLIKESIIIVVDEAHRAGAYKTKKAIDDIMVKLPDCPDKTLIGLTATPGRSTSDDNDNRLFRYMFDNKIIDIDTALLNTLNMSQTKALNTDPEKDIIKYFQDRGVLSKITRETLIYGNLDEDTIKKLKVHMTANGYKDYSEAFLKRVAINKERNTKITNRLIELNNQGKPTIVFACSVEHGKMLSAALTMNGVANGHIFGDMDAADRKTIISRFKDKNDNMNILINYEVLTTGFDSTNIKCVFITRPTQSVVLYSQMLGRGLRGPMMGGNETCLLIDVEDNLKQFNTESEAFNFFNDYWN
ncbi:DEAD/DEAH box helicase [Enterocloster asparagiformis]|uniref:DEAD/DEAH box helicase n=1 Tax=Enterocloster asparagiformis TaxID=333367 RepID=UPI0004AF6B88|nr:DEAD/DEAH box helicase [Enterocloster asparagiformis]